MNLKPMLVTSQVRIALASTLAAVVLVVATAALLQTSPGCRHWRDWKSSKEGQRYITLELFSKPAYCFDL